MKQTGMFIVPLRGLNFGFWSRYCVPVKAPIFYTTKVSSDYVFISLKLISCMLYLCVFKRSLLGVKICLSHIQIGLL